jgi:hypothetical protein
MRFVAPSAAALEGFTTAEDDDPPPTAWRRVNSAAMRNLGITPDATDDDALLLADGPAGGLEAVTTLQPVVIPRPRAGAAARPPS